MGWQPDSAEDSSQSGLPDPGARHSRLLSQEWIRTRHHWPVRWYRFRVDPGDRGGRTGRENVRAVMMPSRHTSQLSLDLAREQAELLGVHCDSISIEPAFEAFLGSL